MNNRIKVQITKANILNSMIILTLNSKIKIKTQMIINLACHSPAMHLLDLLEATNLKLEANIIIF